MHQAVDGQAHEAPSSMLNFTLLKPTKLARTGPALGKLLCKGRSPILTPHYVAPTSRGVIPHVTPDTMQKHTSISAVYIGLEDFIEKSIQNAPILRAPNSASRLSDYIGLADQCLSILGPRRVPRISCPALNTNSSIVISTSVGFQTLEVEEYNEAALKLQPDCIVSVVDLLDADRISKKRSEKSIDRTHGWLRDTVGTKAMTENTTPPLLGSIPPVEAEKQALFLSDLATEYTNALSGLCVYSADTVPSIPKDLGALPRMHIGDPSTPQAVLRSIFLGVDLITIPFVTNTSEQGIAMTFTFTPSPDTRDEPLGYDLWSISHATDLSPLAPGCECYTCTHHHRAYVHHLLQAKEMLAWNLLQIHNYSVVDSFFTQIRQSIDSGTFDTDMDTFNHAYQSEWPSQTGQGPRVRGYQTRSSGGGEPRKNLKAYGRLDDQLEKLAESGSGITTPQGGAAEIEKHGLAKVS